MISVLLVDDHAVVREGYRRLLELQGDLRVVAEAAGALEAIREYSHLKPDVVVMDLALPGVSGIEATRRILARHADARILIFSMYEDAIFATRALAGGARGYLTKASAPDSLVRAVRAVAEGRTYLSESIVGTLNSQGQFAIALDSKALSSREFEVLTLLAQGLPIADIGLRLGISAKTVANQQSLLKQKMGADNLVQLVLIAIERGFIPGDHRIRAGPERPSQAMPGRSLESES